MRCRKERKIMSGVIAAGFIVTCMIHFLGFSAEAREEKTPGKYKELSQVTVTAQKREENVQDVPMGLSVFSDMALEDAGIEDISDLARFTPNLSESEPLCRFRLC